MQVAAVNTAYDLVTALGTGLDPKAIKFKQLVDASPAVKAMLSGTDTSQGTQFTVFAPNDSSFNDETDEDDPTITADKVYQAMLDPANVSLLTKASSFIHKPYLH